MSNYFKDLINHPKRILKLSLVALAVLPELLPSPFAGLIVAVMIYAVGGGLLEVLVSPVVEACPTDNKEAAMSLLHSFYCWGQMGVVLLSSVFFAVFGIAHWRVLALLWAVIPALNCLLFAKVPIYTLIEEGGRGTPLAGLVKSRTFWLLLVLMVCSGASEQAVSQWASTLAEKGLGISKTMGDLAGPMAFAVLMGSSRAFYGKFGEKINLDRFMAGSSILCVIAYLMIAVLPYPVLNLVGCGLCGLSVGIMWPGTFSKASAAMPFGGTAMFALLALAGDLGCSGGPTFAGMVASAAGDDLQRGILCAVLFPALLLVMIFVLGKMRRERDREQEKQN